MSIISASTTTTTAYKVTADTTGTLVLQTGASPTTAVTIGSDQSFNFAVTGQRITGNFSDATVANRVLFQSSVSNGNTYVGAIPNGTGTDASFAVWNSSSPDNASYGSFTFAGGVEARLTSGKFGTGTYYPMTFYTNGAEQMRITTGGNVGIGTNSPSQRLDVQAPTAISKLTSTSGTNACFYWANNTGGNFYIGNDNSAGGSFGIPYGRVLYSDGAYPLAFFTNSVERARIDSSGNLLVNTNSTTVTSGGYTFQTSGYWQVYRNSSTSSDGIVDFYSNWSSTKNNIFRVDSRGNILIATGSTYGNFSDAAFKENIVDATPKLDDLMKIKVRNFTVKGDESGDVYLGYIAQEVETVFPKLVSEIETETGNKKAVKESVFVPMLIKAIQEQQAIIETLTNRIQALENK